MYSADKMLPGYLNSSILSSSLPLHSSSQRLRRSRTRNVTRITAPSLVFFPFCMLHKIWLSSFYETPSFLLYGDIIARINPLDKSFFHTNHNKNIFIYVKKSVFPRVQKIFKNIFLHSFVASATIYARDTLLFLSSERQKAPERNSQVPPFV